MQSAPGTSAPSAKRTMHYHCHTALPWLLRTVKHDQRQEHTVRTSSHVSEHLVHLNLNVIQHIESVEVYFVSAATKSPGKNVKYPLRIRGLFFFLE